jgi:hypothetical protein
MSPSSLQQLQELFVSQSGLFDSIFEKADLQLSVSGNRKNTAIRHLDVNMIALAASPDTSRLHEGPNRFFSPDTPELSPHLFASRLKAPDCDSYKRFRLSLSAPDAICNNVPGERVRPLLPSGAGLHHPSCAACGQGNPAARGHILTVKRLLIEQPTVIDLLCRAGQAEKILRHLGMWAASAHGPPVAALAA